jgi:hypothetical protein
MTERTALAYRLAPPDAFIARENDILHSLFGEAAIGQLTISPTSGCLSYVDATALWGEDGAGVPSLDVETAARAFLERANRAIAALPSQDGARLPLLFPPDLRPAGGGPVCGFDRETIAHWLIRFQPFLPTGAMRPAGPTPVSAEPNPAASRLTPAEPSQTPVYPAQPEVVAPGAVAVDALAGAPVLGATVDVRLSGDGVVRGLRSSWRPWIAKYLVPLLPLEDTGEHGASDDAAQLVYVAAGPDEPQTVLGPHYLHADGSFAPASRSSLTVSIVQQGDETPVRLTAAVGGAGDQLRYAWGCWRLDGPEPQFTSLGEEPEITVTQGLCNVVVDVADDQSGAVARTQALVSAGVDSVS